MGVTIRKTPSSRGGGSKAGASSGDTFHITRVHNKRGEGGLCAHLGRFAGDSDFTALAELVHAKEPAALPYIDLFTLTLFNDAQVVKCGMRPWVVKVVAKDLKIDFTRLVDHLAISRSTYNRKFNEGKVLNVAESERILGVAKLIGQVKAMVAESGDDAEFDAAAWVGSWLDTPLPAIGNRKPIDLMDTGAGQDFVSQLLHQMQSGAYA